MRVGRDSAQRLLQLLALIKKNRPKKLFLLTTSRGIPNKLNLLHKVLREREGLSGSHRRVFKYIYACLIQPV